ncbi:MAG: hypothetical protein NWF05_02415 [Candidatus Bathyarchaeota archaeon]|nr:hypothetical protein [Candidatus Bathyarchaeota archaeon]
MIQKSAKVNNGFEREILEFCRHVAGPYKITAVCQSDDYTIEEPSAKSTVEVLLVLHDFQPRLMSYMRSIDGRNVIFFVVDQWIFERDVDRGFLGEALASRLIFPYTSLVENDFIHRQEIALKTRLILELLENIVLSYPELSHNLRIKPEYFMYEVMLNRVRVFPPMAYGASQFLCGNADKQKVDFVLGGYIKALRLLEKNGDVVFSSDYITLTNAFIKASNNQKTRFTNIIKNAPRTLFSSFFGAFPQLLNFLSQNSEAFFKFQTPLWRREINFFGSFIDPKNYVLVPTAQGFVTLADKVDIRAYSQQFLKTGDYNKIKVEQFGGVLNDVYLIKASTDHSEKKILVKQFKDLHSMKWFPLSIWSLGARSFALLGKSRLERECAINELLANAGFLVPKILHVSADERLVFMEFLEGENLSNAVKRIAVSGVNTARSAKDLELIRRAGETYAKVHALNVVLGDTKPENTFVSPSGEMYLLDFEQASRSGDKSWDIACFLYYCGHYMPLEGEQKAAAIAQAFIDGYLQAGGSAEAVKCAAIVRYTRVFSIFTLPSVLRTMVNTCKSVKGPKCKKW